MANALSDTNPLIPDDGAGIEQAREQPFMWHIVI
jgi:hypothetical protein